MQYIPNDPYLREHRCEYASAVRVLPCSAHGLQLVQDLFKNVRCARPAATCRHHQLRNLESDWGVSRIRTNHILTNGVVGRPADLPQGPAERRSLHQPLHERGHRDVH